VTDANHDKALLEHRLRAAYTALQRFNAEHPNDKFDAVVDKVAVAIDNILRHVPLRTLGDVRLHALALTYFYDEDHDDERVGFLLDTLANLPPKLWDRRIG
jgi:hypothetical protein